MRKSFTGAVALGSLFLVGALPAGAAVQISMPAVHAGVQLAAVGPAEAERKQYKESVRAEMREWRQKMHDLGERAEVKTHKISAAARNKLNRAWARTEAEGRRVERASANGWQRTKNSFERAKESMRDTWHNAFPEDE